MPSRDRFGSLIQGLQAGRLISDPIVSGLQEGNRNTLLLAQLEQQRRSDELNRVLRERQLQSIDQQRKFQQATTPGVIPLAQQQGPTPSGAALRGIPPGVIDVGDGFGFSQDVARNQGLETIRREEELKQKFAPPTIVPRGAGLFDRNSGEVTTPIPIPPEPPKPLGKPYFDRNQKLVQPVQFADGTTGVQEIQGAELGLKESGEIEKARINESEIIDKADVVISKIKEAMPQVGFLTTGFGAETLAKIGGTPARNLKGNLDTIRAVVGFEELRKMRAASPTGGALGQVSERENILLQSARASLDQGQTEEQTMKHLKEFLLHYDTVKALIMIKNNEAPSVSSMATAEHLEGLGYKGQIIIDGRAAIIE